MAKRKRPEDEFWDARAPRGTGAFIVGTTSGPRDRWPHEEPVHVLDVYKTRKAAQKHVDDLQQYENWKGRVKVWSRWELDVVYLVKPPLKDHCGFCGDRGHIHKAVDGATSAQPSPCESCDGKLAFPVKCAICARVNAKEAP